MSFLLVPKERTKEKAPREPALFGSVRSLEKSGSRLTRSVSLRSDRRRFPQDFPTLAHRVQGGKEDSLARPHSGPVEAALVAAHLHYSEVRVPSPLGGEGQDEGCMENYVLVVIPSASEESFSSWIIS